MIKNITFLINRHLRFINPLLCGWEQCSSGHSYGPAIREYWLLHYVVSGKGIFTKGKKSFKLGAGQCFVIRPYEETFYAADMSDPWKYIWVGFSSDIELCETLRVCDVFDSYNYRSVFLDIERALEETETKEEFIYGKLFELFALISSAEKNDISGVDRIAARAKSIIAEKYYEPLTVAQIAQSLHLDRTYFSAAFKRSEGVSPQEYLINYRLNMAATLLLSHNYTPSQAAAAVGYSDPLNFSRMFKRRYGVSPAVYKKGFRPE